MPQVGWLCNGNTADYQPGYRVPFQNHTCSHWTDWAIPGEMAWFVTDVTLLLAHSPWGPSRMIYLLLEYVFSPGFMPPLGPGPFLFSLLATGLLSKCSSASLPVVYTSSAFGLLTRILNHTGIRHEIAWVPIAHRPLQKQSYPNQYTISFCNT